MTIDDSEQWTENYLERKNRGLNWDPVPEFAQNNREKTIKIYLSQNNQCHDQDTTESVIEYTINK
jgi:hypothetical protein